MRLFYTFFLSIIFTLAFYSCQENKWEIDTSSIKVQTKINRFDLDLFELTDSPSDKSKLSELKILYPSIYPLYVNAIMRLGPAKSAATASSLEGFLKDKDIQGLFKSVQQAFPEGNLEKEEKELETGFKYYHHYFPNRVIPDVFTMVSAFAYNTVCDDSLLGISLDTYLGGDFSLYPKTGIPKYKFQNFDRKYLVTDALKAWLLTEFEMEGSQNLLDQMIFHGKVLYLLKAFLAKKDFHLMLNYTKEDLAWCEENEKQIWFHFVDMELLFSIENHKILKFMGDAPFIAGFPEGSPGRVGQWMGYKIVSAYMENNKVSLQELMKIKDSNKILQQSNYKPKR